MELDPRIKSIDSIRSFNTNNDDCLAEEGYFCNYLTSLSNLECCAKGMCIFDDGSRYPFIMKGTRNKYQFFIRKCDLQNQEKQYRPYTLMEFTDKFTIGQPIKFRPKGKVGYERFLILNGYEHEQRGDQTFTYIYIGPIPYTFDELFRAYEWQEHYTEDFEPFGVEE